MLKVNVIRYILVFSAAACCFLTAAHAQADRDAIRGAGTTASTGVGRDAKRLPPDSLTWKKGGDISLNVSQTHFSNWAAGGEHSISIGGASNLFANYRKDKMIWESYAFLAYGVIKTKNRDAVKNSDQFNVGSRVGYQLAKNWYYTAALLGKTQFAPGYKYTSSDTTYISDFLAPANLYLSLGIDYKPSSRFSVSVSPAMGKATFVNSRSMDILLSSGIPQDRIDAGKRAHYEFGGGAVFNLNGSYFDKKLTYTTQLELFSNYFQNPENIDVIWDLQFRIALSRLVSTGVRLNMIYNDDQKTILKEKLSDGTEVTRVGGPKLQVKTYFEIGLFYSF